MKIFAILIVALVAQSYAYSRSQGSEENFGRHQDSRLFQRNSKSSSEEEYNTRNNQQKWEFSAQELEDILDMPSSSAHHHQFQSTASRLPEAETYKNKITQRLNGLSATNPELRRKLINMAEQKLEKCKTPSGNDLDRHCVGRSTGQMMQMIAAVENYNRPSVGYNHKISQY